MTKDQSNLEGVCASGSWNVSVEQMADDTAAQPLGWRDDFLRAFRRDRAEADPAPILRSVGDFAEWRGHSGWPMPTPDLQEIEEYFAALVSRLGAEYAASELAFLQIGAPAIWDAKIGGAIGTVLRHSRCRVKHKPKGPDEKARLAIQSLPVDWQAGLLSKLGSEPGHGSTKWSADYVQAVAYAFARWHRAAVDAGHDVHPSGMGFHHFAMKLRADGVSDRSVSDMLARILSGYKASMASDFASQGCDYVIARHRELSKRAGRPTKTGAQNVGASRIFDLGVHLIDNAREKGPRGLHVARDFRNGLLLAVAAALPQRARALSHLAFGSTLVLRDAPYIEIKLPGHVLKLREGHKKFGGYNVVLNNAILWSALDEYCRSFRPLFDDGAALFPSTLDVGRSISSQQLGRLSGDLTYRHFGVRVSIHRFRDNVATEASEELQAGAYLAPRLLGHKSASTTMQSYDHADGMRAARDLGDHISARRTSKSTLHL